MKRKIYVNRNQVYLNYRKFVNLRNRINELINSGKFFELTDQFRNRLIRRLKILHNRLVRVAGKQKVKWATAAVALILSTTLTYAGYNDPVRISGITLGKSDHPALVDLDKDGDLDLAVGEGSGIIRYFQNDEGTYNELTGSNNPFNGISISYAAPAFTDLDGDGDQDMLVGQNDGVLLYYQNDAGTFNNITGPSSPFDGIDVGDLANPAFANIDGDGDMDLVVGVLDGTIKYFENDGGAFTELTGTDNPFDGIDVGYRSCPSLADYDGDGDLDMFVGEKYGTIVYYQNVAGAFIEQTAGNNPADGIDLEMNSAVTAVDLDGDGDFDLVSGNYDESTLFYYMNEGGVLAERRGTANPFEGLVANVMLGSASFGDYDADGEQELVIGDIGGNFYLYENDGEFFTPVDSADNPFVELTFNPVSTPVLADIDGDGDMDLLAGNQGGTIQYFVNDAGEYFELTGAGNPFDGFDVGGYSAPAICDFDGDGDPDMFVGNNSGLLAYYRNVTGVFIEQTGANNPFDGVDFGSYIRPVFKDIDGDGDLDAVIEEDNSDAIKYLENVEGVFTERTGIENPFDGLGINVPSPAFYDYDHDGDDDLIIAEYLGIFLAEYTPPGVNVNIGSGINTTEAGGTAIFSIVLESKPKADVEIALESSDIGEGTIDVSLATFTPANWDTPQVITATGVDDAELDGDQSYTINVTVTSTDPEYDGLSVTAINAVNIDDEQPEAVETIGLDQIKIYSNEKVVQFDAGEILVEKVEIYSISGKLISSATVNASGRFEIPLYEADSGVYLVRTYSSDDVITVKVVIK